MKLAIYYHTKKLKDGTRPVMLRLTTDRESKYREIISIEEEFWDFKKKEVKKSNPLHQQYNEKILKELNEAQGRLLDIERSKKDVDVSFILGKKDNSKSDLENMKFSALCDIYLEDKRIVLTGGSMSAYDSIAKILKTIIGNIKVKNFKKDSSLEIVRVLKDRENKNSTIKGAITFANQVFGHFDLPLRMINYLKLNETNREALTKANVEKLESLDLKGDLRISADVFLLQYYCKGSRVSDITFLKTDSVKEETIEFTQTKTGKTTVVKRFYKIDIILDRYYKKENMFVFSRFNIEKYLVKPGTDIEKKRNIYKARNGARTIVNRNLKLIEKQFFNGSKITSHIARHTFTSHAEEAGENLRDIQGHLGHSKLETTEIYAKKLSARKKSDISFIFNAPISEEEASRQIKELAKHLSPEQLFKILMEKKK